MPHRRLTFLSAAIILLMIAASLAAGFALPDEARLPVHWDIAGQPDRFADKWTALLMLPLVTLLVAALFAALPRLEPRREGLQRSQGLVAATWAATLVVMATIHGATLATALGWQVPVASIVMLAVGGLLLVIGDQLAKSRRMFLVGIRTPWTLADEDIWIATHRLGGRLMMGCGLCLWALALARPEPSVAGALLAAALGVTIVLPVVYSYLLWRRRSPRG